MNFFFFLKKNLKKRIKKIKIDFVFTRADIRKIRIDKKYLSFKEK